MYKVIASFLSVFFTLCSSVVRTHKPRRHTACLNECCVNDWSKCCMTISRISGLKFPTTLGFLALLSCFAQPSFAIQEYPFPVKTYNLAGAPAVQMNRSLTAIDKIHVENGHFYTQDKKRVRFWGANLSPHMLFPVDATAADRVASHLEKMGINLVRVHALDSKYDSIFPTGSLVDGSGYPNLNQTNLAAFDRLLTAFRAHGIYIDLILKTGAGNQASPMDLFNRTMIDQQKQYAQVLLGHIVQNYNEVLAMVEINNENSLIAYYSLEQTKPLPPAYADELTSLWNVWLYRTYGTTENLLINWMPDASSVGNPLLKNGDFSSGTAPARTPYGANDWYITDVTCPTGPSTTDDLWTTGIVTNSALQLNAHNRPCKWQYSFLGQNNLSLVKDESYVLHFQASASPARNITIGLQQLSGSFLNAWPNTQVAIANTTSTHDYCMSSTLTASDIRLAFNPWVSRDTDTNTSDPLDNQTGWLTLDNISLLPDVGEALRSDEYVAETGGTVQRAQQWANVCPSFSIKRYQDYARFLASVERDYYTEMRDYVRTIAGTTPVTGSQVFFGGSHGGLIGNKNVADIMDFVDAHFYWDHPEKTPSASWTMENISMVERPDDYRNLPTYIAASRVKGMPLTISEYSPNHANRYAEEGYLMMSAYSALQDIDAVMVFDHYVWNKYNLPGGSGYDTNTYYELMPAQLNGWYSILGESRAESLMHLAANIFRRADISAARNIVEFNVSEATRIEQITTANRSVKDALESINDGSTHVDVHMGLVSRVAMAHNDSPQPTLTPLSGPPYISDTGELIWNYQANSSRFIADGQRTKAVSGYLGTTSELNGMTVTGLGTQFGVLSATAMDNKPLATSQQILITTISEGKNQNTTYVPQNGRVQLCYDGNGDGYCYDNNSDGNYDNSADKYFYDSVAGPFNVQNNPARVRLTGAATTIRVQRLGTDGQLKKDTNDNVLPDVALAPVIGGYEFDVGVDGDNTPWYLVTSSLPQAANQTRFIEVENGQISGDPASNKPVQDSNASGSAYVRLGPDGEVSIPIPDDLLAGRYYIEVKAAGLEDDGAPMLRLLINGNVAGSDIALADVLGNSWMHYLAGNSAVDIPSGTGRVIALQNIGSGARYALLDAVQFYLAGTQPQNDADGDGIPNEIDNCPSVANPGQADSNGNGIGDVCDSIDLSIAATASPTSVNANGQLTYTATVTNNAPSSASGVTVIDILPTSVNFVSASSGCSGSPTVTCAIGNLASGASATLTITVTPTVAGTLSNTFTVTGVDYDPVITNNSVIVTTTVDKSTQNITVSTAAPASAAYGSTFTVTATASSGLPVVITTTGGGCSIAGSTVTMTSGTSACTVNYNQAGDSNYTAATQVFSATTATKASQAITVNPVAPASAGNGSTFTVAATSSSGLSVAISTAGGCTNIGGAVTMTSSTLACTVNYNQAGDSNYTAATQVFSTTTPTSGIDLVPLSTSASRVTNSNTKVSVTDTIKNQGNANSGGFTIRYYLSINATYESTDIPLASSSNGTGTCSRTLNSLNKGSSSTATGKTCYKPSGISAGVTYNVLVVDDWGTAFPGGAVGEYNEANNVSVAGSIAW